MKPKIKRPPGLGSYIWPKPNKIDPGNIIKAEAHCLIWTEQLADGTFVVAKMYYRRGFVNFLRGLVLNFRSQREHRILEHLMSCGVSCSEPLYWTYGYCIEHGFYDMLCTRQIPDTTSLETFLSSPSLRDHAIDFGPLFQLLYKMHQCGVYHGALSTKNILVDATDVVQAKFFVIDLARGWLFSASVLNERIAWLDVLKLVRNIESHIGTGNCQPYLANYGTGKEAVETISQYASRYQSYSRKQKRIKNIMKVKVFLFVIITKLSQFLHELDFFI